MTDKATRLVTLAAENHTGSAFLFMISRSDDGRILMSVFFGKDIGEGDLTVQYRIDSEPMKEESWTLVGKAVGCINNREMLRALLRGSRLKVRFAFGRDTTSIFEYDVRGLAPHLAWLGINVD